MAQQTTGTPEYPLMPEGWHRIRVVTSTRPTENRFGPQLQIGIQWISGPEQKEDQKNSMWNTWLSVRKGGVSKPTDLVPKLVAACRGLTELPEGTSYDDEQEPIAKEIEAHVAHYVKGEKSANAGQKQWKFDDFRPAPSPKISDAEALSLKKAFKSLYHDVDDEALIAAVQDVIKKATKAEAPKKTSELSPSEAALVWARLEALSDAKGIVLER